MRTLLAAGPARSRVDDVVLGADLEAGWTGTSHAPLEGQLEVLPLLHCLLLLLPLLQLLLLLLLLVRCGRQMLHRLHVVLWYLLAHQLLAIVVLVIHIYTT